MLVQGDTGPGNFVFENGKVTGIVDWEFAHLGDPMDDGLARHADAATPISSGTAGAVPTGDRYQIDHDRIRYYRAAVDYRCAVTTSLAVSRGGGARGWAPYLLVDRPLHPQARGPHGDFSASSNLPTPTLT